MARVVQGIPTSWDPSIASTGFLSQISAFTWSPCSRFIAIARASSSEIAILDTVTLEQLHTMHPSQNINWTSFIFSPDGCLLTGYSWDDNCIVSWDLQTGGPISNISTQELCSSTSYPMCSSMSYSRCGTMLGALFENIITTYNTVSGTHISSHSIPGSVIGTIWTHGEYLQFATLESGSITIWEVSFTSSHAPTEIHSLPTPDNFSSRKEFLLLPTLSRLAFILQERVLVWDPQHQKTLLDFKDVRNPDFISFSSDGCFFICGTKGPEFHLWKESPDGYLPHQNLIPGTKVAVPVISPNGDLILSVGIFVLQLFHTTNSPTSPPSAPTQVPQHTERFLLEFSPNESLVAFTWWSGSTVTVLDVKSGNLLLVIDTSAEIYGMRITGSSIIVICDGKIVTWDLPSGDSVLNTRVGITNSIQATTFGDSAPMERGHASISLDLDHIALQPSGTEELFMYNMHTGKLLAATRSHGHQPGFTLDGHKVWCATVFGDVEQWAIVKDDGSNITRLESIREAEEPLNSFPWHSSYGYQVTGDGWVLSSSGKQLLWLPHQWQPVFELDQQWSGNVLALLQVGLPEAVILELEV